MNGQVNSRNVRAYAPIGNPPAFNYDVSSSLGLVCVEVDKLLLRFFFERSVDGVNYLEMINTDVLLQLLQHFEMQVRGAFRHLWWVQDGAPAHRLRAVTARLISRFSTSEYFRAKRLFSFVSTLLVPLGFSRKLKDKGKKSLRAKIFASGKPAIELFGNRVIALHHAVEWPPRLPDLTPCDFFLWRYLKSKVYTSLPVELNCLQARIFVRKLLFWRTIRRCLNEQFNCSRHPSTLSNLH